MVISILLVTTLFQKNILDFGDIKNKSFPTSAYFSSLFQESTETIFHFVELRKKFETDGNYDSEKKIDIKKYYSSQGRVGDVSGDKLTEDETQSRRYYLGDLAEWARSYTTSDYQFTSTFYINNGIYQKQNVTRDGASVFNQERQIESLGDMSAELQMVIVSHVERSYGGSYNVTYFESGREFDTTTQVAEENDLEMGQSKEAASTEEGQQDEQLEEIIQRVIAGELYELNSDELALLLQDLGMSKGSYSNEYSFVNEDYLSVDGRGIWTDFIQGKCTEVQMQQLYEALEYTLENIGQEVNTYKKCLNRYNLGKEGSNVYYWIKKGNEDSVYTNLEEEEIDDFTAYGKEMGKYFFYRESDMRLETNVKGMEDIFYNGMEQMYGGKGNIMFICVNTSFPQEDSFYEAKQEYNQMYPWIYIGTVAMVISALGCLICFIYLSTIAGKTGENKEPVICWFDKIPTELVFIAAAISAITAIVFYGEVFYRFGASELAGLLVISGVLAFLASALFMLFYLSFVRRIRAGVLWSGSITHWIVQGIGSIFHARKPATKMIVWFGIHFLSCLIMIPLLMEWDEAYQMLGIIWFIGMSLIEGVLIVREGVQRNQV